MKGQSIVENVLLLAGILLFVVGTLTLLERGVIQDLRYAGTSTDLSGGDNPSPSPRPDPHPRPPPPPNPDPDPDRD